METKLTINLFDPGMSAIHRVGLAGLGMTLMALDPEEPEARPLNWHIRPDGIELTIRDTPAAAMQWLFERAYGIDAGGLIDFRAHRSAGWGDVQRVHLHSAVQSTFLQHNKQNRIPKGTTQRAVNFDLQDEVVKVFYRPFGPPYAYMTEHTDLTDRKGRFVTSARIKSWLFPGAVERHAGLSGTAMEEPPARLLCLLFAPVASLYYRISHRDLIGKPDKRRATAVVLPHVVDIQAYSRAYRSYLAAPVDLLYADGSSDAALQAMITLRGAGSFDLLPISGCTVVLFGSLPWASQQKTRTDTFDLAGFDTTQLTTFELAVACLPNRIRAVDRKTDSGPARSFAVFPSQIRGLIADNISNRREWFAGFFELMRSEQRAKQTSYEKEGLHTMVEHVPWNHDVDKRFIEAVHVAIRSRYGQLAAYAKSRGENVRFDREYTRIRTAFTRAKNLQTLRAELGDLFAKGGINKTLQEYWQNLLPQFTGGDWQRTRDLALLALASYKGAGAEQASESEAQTETEEND